MRKNIVLCGVGGQGTVLASKLIAAAAMAQQMPVMSAETIGMAQRGGSVFSHLRIGEGVHTPMIGEGEADLILGFEPGETVRMLPYLKKGGQVVVSNRPVMPVTASVSGAVYSGEDMLAYLQRNVENLMIVDADKACQDLGSAKVLNILMLGAALQTGALGMNEDVLVQVMKERIPEKFWDMNMQALHYFK